MRAEKARFAFSVAGVAVAALLLAFMLALYSGWSERIAAYVNDVPADVWVSQSGNQSFFAASLVPDKTFDDVAGRPGVLTVSTLLGRSLKIKHGDSTYDSYVLGFDADGIGGPLHIKSGRGTPADGEIVIDDVLARTADVGVGDEITANDQTLRVVGVSTGGNIVINQLSFVSKDEAHRLVGISGIANFGLLKTEPGQAKAVVADINANVPGVSAFERKEFASNSRQVLKRSMLPILSVVIVMVFVVGAVVVGLTIYTATMEKEREFGVMKALGTPHKFLMLAVGEQSMLCGLIGFAVGEIAVVGASRFAERMVPQFVTLLRWQDALIVLAAVVAMSLLAAYLPIRKVLSVDPLRVFKA